VSRTRGHGTGHGAIHPKGGGFEFWSRRPPKWCPPGKVWKRITHAIERARAKREVEEVPRE
jgi:hypothetical protein